jgi:hypothetical protein
MKKLLVLISLLAVSGTVHAIGTSQSFNATMRLMQPIVITTVQGLTFPDQSITGSAFTATVATTDAGAATFNATGGNNRTITSAVGSSSIVMTSGSMNMTVDTFVVTGPTAFVSGVANGFKVGATAHITTADLDGNYTGSNTFTIAYQ